MVESEGWSNNATFPYDEYKNVKDVVTCLHVALAKSKRPIVISSTGEDTAEFLFPNGCGISLHDRSLLDVLGFEEVPDHNRGAQSFGNTDKVKKQVHSIMGD